MSAEEIVVQSLILAVRLLLPLAIPRYPLPGILAALIVDSADQTILEAFGVYVPAYQNIDKALDVYYLSIAYVATMRNWENTAALQIARALFYYRVIGVLAFELTNVRLLLAFFPNAFEAFFIYYEIVRLWGNPMVGRKALIGVTAVIWLVVKLPHEWWIHVAQMNTTDFIKTRILGASLDTSFWAAIYQAPLVTGTIAVAFAIGALFAWRFVRRRRGSQASASNRRVSRTRVEALRKSVERGLEARDWVKARTSPVRPAVIVEKIVLVTLVSMIFQQTLPGMHAGGLQTALFIALTIVTVDYLLRWIAGRFGHTGPPWVDLPLLAVLDFCIVLVFQLTIVRPTNVLIAALVFASVITFFVALYDLYRPLYDQRQDRLAAARRRVEASEARS